MSAPIKPLWNRKQDEARLFVARYHPRFLILDGAIGSGKTSIGLSAWVARIYENRDKGNTYIMTGYTLGSLKRNCLDPLWEDFGINTDLNDENCFMMFGNKVFCFGADKADSYKPIRGITTAHGHYGNEVTLCNRKALEECFNRCRGQDAFYIWETNPDSPEHWIYQGYVREAIEKGNTARLARFSFTLYDNAAANGGFLPPEYIAQQERLYSGIWHRQYILGEWCSLEGQIYHLDALQYYDDSVLENPDWWNGTTLHGHLDPAAGSTKKAGCYTSIISGALKGTGGDIYLTDAFVRKAGIEEMKVAAGERLKRRTYSRFTYEDNYTQEEYVGKPLKAAFPWQPIYGQAAHQDKLTRLIAMHGAVTTKVRFPERWRTERGTDGWMLLQQLCNITKERDERADTDEMFLDAPDALEGLIRSFRVYDDNSTTVRAGGTPVKRSW